MEYLPLAQSVHPSVSLTAPALLPYCPGLHPRQLRSLILPVSLLYLPLMQFLQFCIEACPSSLRYLPAPQFLHASVSLAVPGVVPCFPIAQSIHLVKGLTVKPYHPAGHFQKKNHKMTLWVQKVQNKRDKRIRNKGK